MLTESSITIEHTREGPDVFPGVSLSDRTSVDGGGHGAEGKDERNKSKTDVRLYRFREYISEICDGWVIWGRRPGQDSPSLQFGWPEELHLAEDHNVCQWIRNLT